MSYRQKLLGLRWANPNITLTEASILLGANPVVFIVTEQDPFDIFGSVFGG